MCDRVDRKEAVTQHSCATAKTDKDRVSAIVCLTNQSEGSQFKWVLCS